MHIGRDRLHRLLDDVVGHGVAVVGGGPGFGKTTLLRDRISRSGLDVISVWETAEQHLFLAWPLIVAVVAGSGGVGGPMSRCSRCELGVVDRDGAVQRATAVGLLEEVLGSSSSGH